MRKAYTYSSLIIKRTNMISTAIKMAILSNFFIIDKIKPIPKANTKIFPYNGRANIYVIKFSII